MIAGIQYLSQSVKSISRNISTTTIHQNLQLSSIQHALAWLGYIPWTASPGQPPWGSRSTILIIWGSAMAARRLDFCLIGLSVSRTGVESGSRRLPQTSAQFARIGPVVLFMKG